MGNSVMAAAYSNDALTLALATVLPRLVRLLVDKGALTEAEVVLMISNSVSDLRGGKSPEMGEAAKFLSEVGPGWTGNVQAPSNDA